MCYLEVSMIDEYQRGLKKEKDTDKSSRLPHSLLREDGSAEAPGRWEEDENIAEEDGEPHEELALRTFVATEGGKGEISALSYISFCLSLSLSSFRHLFLFLSLSSFSPPLSLS